MADKAAAILHDIYDAWRTQNLSLMASYLPDDFCHVIHIPPEVHPLGGLATGKLSSLDRMRKIASAFEFLAFDTEKLMVRSDYAGVEISFRYRHRETGTKLESTLANFWEIEDGWPVRLNEYHDVAKLQAFTNSLKEKRGW